MEKIDLVKFTPTNFSYFVLFLTFAEHLPVKTNAIKFLGLQLEGQLSWNHHISNLKLHTYICFKFLLKNTRKSDV